MNHYSFGPRKLIANLFPSADGNHRRQDLTETASILVVSWIHHDSASQYQLFDVAISVVRKQIRDVFDCVHKTRTRSIDDESAAPLDCSVYAGLHVVVGCLVRIADDIAIYVHLVRPFVVLRRVCTVRYSVLIFRSDRDSFV